MWDETFSFVVESMDDTVMLEMWDKDCGSGDDFMGEVGPASPGAFSLRPITPS